MTPKTSPSECAATPALFPTGNAPDETVGQTHSEKARLAVAEKEERTVEKILSRSMSLFEIDETLSALMDAAVEAAGENNGEIPAELRQALLDYCEAFGQKVDNIARYIRSQEFEAVNANAEIERLERRRAAAEHRAERLKALLKFFMESRNIQAMKGVLNRISLRKNSQDSLILGDTAQLPAQFWRVTVVLSLAVWQEIMANLPQEHGFKARFENPQVLKREPDNATIRAALANGAVLEGAELRRGHHVRLT